MAIHQPDPEFGRRRDGRALHGLCLLPPLRFTLRSYLSTPTQALPSGPRWEEEENAAIRVSPDLGVWRGGDDGSSRYSVLNFHAFTPFYISA
ncbi:hypothetical protein ACN47E_007675 [Coniothyrium glycines]